MLFERLFGLALLYRAVNSYGWCLLWDEALVIFGASGSYSACELSGALLAHFMCGIIWIFWFLKSESRYVVSLC